MRKVFLVVLLLATCSAILSATDTLDVYFIDVGQGDAILIDYGTYELLIDGGADGSCIPFLDEYVDGYLEFVVATHPHSDHIGGLDDVIRAFDVLEVITNGATAATNAYLGFSAAASTVRRPVTVSDRNDIIQLGDIELKVLHPHESTGDANEDSLVLLLTYGEIEFLFTGDIGKEGESELLNSLCLTDIDILKVAHHGSRYSSSSDFLDVVLPELAIYSAGVGNQYGHPHNEALGRLSVAGALILGTDEYGTIRLSTDGTNWTAANLAGSILASSSATATHDSELYLEIEPVDATGQGGNATVTAQTAPGATCSVVVRYGTRASVAQGLTPRVSDADGSVSWSWRVGTNTAPGNHEIVITATVGAESVTKSIWFEVIDTGNPG